MYHRHTIRRSPILRRRRAHERKVGVLAEPLLRPLPEQGQASLPPACSLCRHETCAPAHWTQACNMSKTCLETVPLALFHVPDLLDSPFKEKPRPLRGHDHKPATLEFSLSRKAALLNVFRSKQLGGGEKQRGLPIVNRCNRSLKHGDQTEACGGEHLHQ